MPTLKPSSARSLVKKTSHVDAKSSSAAPASPPRRRHHSPPRIDQPHAGLSLRAMAALNKVEHDLGGRLSLVTRLAPLESDPKVTTLLSLLADPYNEGVGLGRLCDLSGLRMTHFFDLLRKGKGIIAVDKAMDAVYDKLPPVAEHVMSRALPREVTCPSCFGAKERVRLRCANCFGTGMVVLEPDKDHWQAALEMGGLLKRGGGVQVGVQVNQSQHLHSGPPSENSSNFRSATDEILFGGRREVQDAEVVASDGEEAQESA